MTKITHDRRKREAMLGLSPAPPSLEQTAILPPPVRGPRPESVAEFLQRGGRVERLQGFERVHPYRARPVGRRMAA